MPERDITQEKNLAQSYTLTKDQTQVLEWQPGVIQTKLQDRTKAQGNVLGFQGSTW